MTRHGGGGRTVRAGTLILTCLLAACTERQPTLGELLAPHAPTPVPDAKPGVSYLVIGKRLLDAGQHETALKAFLRSARIEGVTAAAMNGAGVAAENLGRTTEAREYFRRAVELDPNSILARNNYGVALYKSGDYHMARSAFEAAFALSNGQNAVAARNLGLVEHKIAEIEGDTPIMIDTGYNVVRTGSSVYSLTPSGEEPGEGGG